MRAAAGVCLVTGGASGLGAAITERLRADGWDVVVADIDDAGEGSVRCDVTSASDVAAAVAEATARGPLRGMVLGAAIETRSSIVDCSDEDWQRVLDVDLKGPFLCLKHAVPAMVAGGGGSVVALGSTLGSIVAPQYPAYCAAKHALSNLCKQVAIEHARDGVRVNVLSLGPCDTGLFVRLTDLAPDPVSVRAGVAANLPMGRLGQAHEVAAMTAFLLSDAAAFTSGAVIPLDGGLAARRM
jgi:NAD(P)-dependent dehydrogenase (short-subunit alcohol dehydrogenase family)